MEARPWRPLSLRDLLDEAVRSGRRHFRATYPGAAVPVALGAGLFSMTQASLMGFAGEGGPPGPRDLFLRIGVVFAAALFYGVAYGIGSAALVAAASDAVGGAPVSMRRAWGAMFRPRAVGTLLLMWLAFIFGLLFCVLPGLYAGIVFGLTVPVMFQERRFGFSALGRSRALLSHNPRRQLGDDPRVKLLVVSLVGFLLAYALGFVVQMPFMVAQQVLLFRGIASGQTPDPSAVMAQMYWLQVPGAILGALAGVATQLYVSFGVALLFFDIKGRKEGADLEAALDALLRKGGPAGEAR